MPIVNGIYRDFSFAFVPLSAGPQISFVPSGPAVGGTSVFTTPTVDAVIDQYGNWTASLMNYEATRPPVHYMPRLTTLDPGGNFTHVDFTDWDLWVPAEGGFFSDLVSTAPNPLIVWWSNIEPISPTKNMTWVNTDTGDVMKWS